MTRYRSGASQPARKPNSRLSIVVKVLAALLVAGLCALFSYFGYDAASELPYRAGWQGTPGTLHAISCTRVGTGRSASELCQGQFTATAGGPARQVSVEGDESFPAGPLPARLHPDGSTASVTELRTLAYALGNSVLPLVPLELVLFGVLGARRKRYRLGWWVLGLTLTLGLLALLIGLIA